MVLGYVNIIILFPAVFSEEEFGLIQLLAGMGIVYAQFSALGLVNIIVRFFPFFKSDDKKHDGFIFFTMMLMTAGFTLITLLYVIFKPVISEFYIENSSLFVDYYYWLIPISFFLLIFLVFDSIVRAIHKTVFSAFLRDVLFRGLTTVGIGLVFLQYLDFEEFLLYYVVIHGVIMILLLGQILRSREFKPAYRSQTLTKLKMREITGYGLFSLLAGSSYFLAQNIDKIMIGSMVGLGTVAVYSVYIYIATVIIFPARSLYRIAIPTITEAWKDNNLDLIRDMYKRTSLILMIVGSILYIGILVNKENILHFINPDYRDGFDYFIFLGLAMLIDMSGGLNSDIIGTSVKYKFDALFNAIYSVLCILLNVIFINLYGALGAAIATAISMLIFNILKWSFLLRSYNMQPFGIKNLVTILIAIAALFTGWYLPYLGNVFADIVYRSFITAAVFFGAIIIFKVSNDINEKFDKYARKLKLIR
jgi:O-antigen/teichoic acid export membrane protein